MSLVRTFVRVLRKLGVLRHVSIVVPVRLNGRRTRIPLIKGVGLLNVVEFEPFMDTIISRALPRFPGVFLDVGVNVAQTLIKAKNLFPEVEYLGFEPNATCVSYTRKIVDANRYDKVSLVPAGLTNADGEGALVLWQGGVDDPSATLVPGFRASSAGERTITVPLTRWATVEKRMTIGRLGFVKIDVEGGELEVLKELAPRLRTDRPLVALEVLPTHVPPIPERLQRQETIRALIEELRYRIHRIHRKGVALQLEPIASFGIHADLELIDHLLVPMEREGEVIEVFATTAHRTDPVTR